MSYEQFLKSKVIIAEHYGFDPAALSEMLNPHQVDIVNWAVRGGRRAVFASFGLGKTFMQLELARQCMLKENKPFLICCPLGVVGEFRRDNRKLKTGYAIEYITDSDSVDEYELKIYLTNYERVRKGDIDPSRFSGVSFDEASILRNLKTETTNYVLTYFRKVPYRFVATATPSPNDYIELLNYADYLGIADRGQVLTRFFKRNPVKAGDLQLMESKKKEFWQWVSTWAAFINKPSDLGYPDTGYELPALNIIEHRIENLADAPIYNKYGDLILFRDTTKGLPDAMREKRDSIAIRSDKALEIMGAHPGKHFVVWHHLEGERHELERRLLGMDFRSVFGSQDNEVKEKNLIDFSEGGYQYLLTKPKIAGSGCNFQEHCSDCIFLGIDFKFNDFIQAIHRFYRFRQQNEVNVHIIYTNNEDHVLKTLFEKWTKHNELQDEMAALIREYGLNENLIKSQMERQIFKNGDKTVIGNATLYNNDCVIAMDDIADASIDLIVTSIPFGDHYEYSENYNDFGHNNGNEAFFRQMDFLTPKLLRALKPGRIAAIHVKDRIRYSYQNGTSFTTIDDFSGDTVRQFQKHGFYLMGKITITTDVVSENNQTNRLGHSEQCKDATKMGVGLPEYVLLFRKAPTEKKNAYADQPVRKSKQDYPLSIWQLDAHAYWRSSGNRALPVKKLKPMTLKEIVKRWKARNLEEVYSFEGHINECDQLDEAGFLSKKHMTLPPYSNNEMVWTDINRMNTLNLNQVSKKKEKHICPLQLDIIERLINRFSMEGEVVLDPFGGLFSVPYMALKKNRCAIGIELNKDYYRDGVFYVRSMHEKINMPTLFDELNLSKKAI